MSVSWLKKIFLRVNKFYHERLVLWFYIDGINMIEITNVMFLDFDSRCSILSTHAKNFCKTIWLFTTVHIITLPSLCRLSCSSIELMKLLSLCKQSEQVKKWKKKTNMTDGVQDCIRLYKIKACNFGVFLRKQFCRAFISLLCNSPFPLSFLAVRDCIKTQYRLDWWHGNRTSVRFFTYYVSK